MGVELGGAPDAFLLGGGLRSAYRLQQFHFHWAQDDDEDGSEHAINGRRYPLEVRFFRGGVEREDVVFLFRCTWCTCEGICRT